MSVLNQSGEEQVECPLCMEPLEVDDLNFFPCTCGYQICRFCWHRIRTDENGLCPACRKAYSENPADFTPLSREQVAQLKAEKRQRDQQRKAKLSESRKHLANVRVVQKNLVFVVGLPMRLADPEILKRHEYFGKFGKIHKVVINQSTSYAGSQGPSASAYVTYMKSDDALRAIQSVNNITIDGRLVKSSLGTTKYCSHFMKNQPCPKPDCMYLHDFGDPEASFTKEQMHAGKHQEYEKKLHDALLTKMATQGSQQQPSNQGDNGKSTAKSKDPSSNPATGGTNNNKDGWPQLNNPQTDKTAADKTAIPGGGDKKAEKSDSLSGGKEKGQKSRGKTKNNNDCKKVDRNKNCETSGCHGLSDRQSGGYGGGKGHLQERDRRNGRGEESKARGADKTSSSSRETSVSRDSVVSDKSPEPNIAKLQISDENSSFFSQNTFQKLSPDSNHNSPDETSNLLHDSAADGHTSHILNDSLPNINSSEDWEAAFGFSKKNSHMNDLEKQRHNVKDTLETFGNGFNLLGQQEFSKLDTFSNDGFPQNTFDTTKLHESILDALNSKNQFFSNPFTKSEDRLGSNTSNHHYGPNGLNGLNGLDQQMSKFFTDFCNNKSGQNGLLPNGLSHTSNGLTPHNGLSQNGFLHSLADRHNFLIMQQKQIEEQLLSLKQQHQSYGQQLLQQNGLHHGAPPFLNGDVLGGGPAGFGPLQDQLYHHTSLQPMGTKQNSRAEDELDFDPFHETQKALAELIENEQNHKLHSGGRSNVSTNQMNGLVHSQSGSNGHLPPPPPGFVQPNTHMNSFGSKILPYLNMNSSQHQQINSSNQNNWPGSYSQIQQQKGLGNCNDWKVLDPAIVSSSRHFPLANMHIRDQFSPLQHQQQQQQPPIQLQNGGGAPPMRSFDYTSFSSSFNSNPQLQAFNNFSHLSNSLAAQQNLNWLAGSAAAELGSQISSPPGFRTGSQVVTKQQEC